VVTDTKNEQLDSFALLGDDREFVQVNPYQVHVVLNPSDETCELLVISSEEYNPEDTDTYRAEEDNNA
tara:strand:+ start:7396 stop:7599 length:204 start_codon:yes stop_codon:yes gene_type:complete